MKNVLFFSSEQSAIAEALSEEAVRYGWQLRVIVRLSKDAVMHELQPSESKRHGRQLDRHIPELIKFWKPVGCIVEKCPDIFPSAFGKIPCVFIGRNPADLKHSDALIILHDTEKTVQLAVEELMRPGIQHFGWVGYTNNWYWNREREETFARVVQLNGKTLHAFRTPFDPAVPVATVKQLRKWVKELPKPCGIFVSNDYLGSTLLNACADEKINVPSEISVVSVDDIARICNNTKPPMTSIPSDFHQAGRMAAALLAEKLANPNLKCVTRRFEPICITHRLSSGVVFDRHVSAVSEIIRTKAASGIKARDVFKELACSRRYAEQRFRMQTGSTVLGMIRERRINIAMRLLTAGNLSLGEIALRCGYARPESLYKAFHAATGLSPSAWRRKHR